MYWHGALGRMFKEGKIFWNWQRTQSASCQTYKLKNSFTLEGVELGRVLINCWQIFHFLQWRWWYSNCCQRAFNGPLGILCPLNDSQSFRDHKSWFCHFNCLIMITTSHWGFCTSWTVFREWRTFPDSSEFLCPNYNQFLTWVDGDQEKTESPAPRESPAVTQLSLEYPPWG